MIEDTKLKGFSCQRRLGSAAFPPQHWHLCQSLFEFPKDSPLDGERTATAAVRGHEWNMWLWNPNGLQCQDGSAEVSPGRHGAFTLLLPHFTCSRPGTAGYGAARQSASFIPLSLQVEEAAGQTTCEHIIPSQPQLPCPGSVLTCF